MKMHYFICLLFAAFFAPASIFSQAAPTSSEASQLLAACSEARPEMQEALTQALRSTKPWAGEVATILRNSLSLMDRIERAGTGMSATTLKSFKSELERLSKQLDEIKNPDGQSLKLLLFECYDACWDKYPKVWQTLRRIGCIVRCLMNI